MASVAFQSTEEPKRKDGTILNWSFDNRSGFGVRRSSEVSGRAALGVLSSLFACAPRILCMITFSIIRLVSARTC
jgi:hypothetical protein